MGRWLGGGGPRGEVFGSVGWRVKELRSIAVGYNGSILGG
jgi:hypothetical protein